MVPFLLVTNAHCCNVGSPFASTFSSSGITTAAATLSPGSSCNNRTPQDVARRLFKPRFQWPRVLRNKWISVALFVAILFAYELFDLWSSPWWTAWLILGYFTSALVVDGLFHHASFCKFVCPIGQFNFVASTLSPLEVKERYQDICTTCMTKDCIRGLRKPKSELVVIPGCELALFQPRKVGNMDCTFCLDCIHAGGIDPVERAFCLGRELLQVVVEAFGEVVPVWVRGVFNGQVGGIVAQLRPENAPSAPILKAGLMAARSPLQLSSYVQLSRSTFTIPDISSCFFSEC